MATKGARSVGRKPVVPNSLGPSKLLMGFRTKEQYWRHRLADGLEIPCFGLTSPKAC